MKKRYLFVSILTLAFINLLLGCKVAQEPAMKTVISEETRTTIPLDGGDTTTTTTVYHYSDDGVLLSEEFTGWNGTHVTTYMYDEDGRLTSEEKGTGGNIDYFYDDTGNMIRKTEVDEFGTMTYDYTYYPDGKVYTESRTYSDENRASNASSYMQDGDCETITYQYDYYGHVISKTSVYSGPEGDLHTSIETYTYGGDSDRLAQESYFYEGSAECYSLNTTYTYDAWGNMLTKTCTDQYGNISEINCSYTYDNLENMLEEVVSGFGGYSIATGFRNEKSDYSYYSGNLQSETTSWTYDERGNMLSCDSTFAFGISREKYAYDENDNIITKEERVYDETGTLSQDTVITAYKYIDVPDNGKE